MGTWDLVEGRKSSADKKGLPNEKLGWFFFPEVKDGKGKANDLFASLDGWLVSKQAPKETTDFMRVWLGKETQNKLAEEGLFIPAVKGTAEVIKDPFLKGDRRGNRQIAMDRDRRRSVAWTGYRSRLQRCLCGYRCRQHDSRGRCQSHRGVLAAKQDG